MTIRELASEGLERRSVHVCISTELCARIELDLDADFSLATHVATACEQLDVKDRPSYEYTLLAPAPDGVARYLSAEEWLDGVPEWLTDFHALELVLAPAVEVAEVLDQLAEPSGDSDSREQKKRRVYWLRRRLLNYVWVEEFVAQNGLTVLLELLESTSCASANDGGGDYNSRSTGSNGSSNGKVGGGSAARSAIGDGQPRASLFHGDSGASALQGYCLMALRQALCWQCAMAVLCGSDSHTYLLFSLLYSERPRVISRALELLFVCSSATESLEDASITYATLHAAAVAAAHANDDKPFAILVLHVKSPDMDVQLSAITLINCLISASGTWQHRQRLLFTLDLLGVNNALFQCLEASSTDERVQGQLDV